MNISPAALIATIRINLARHPLWPLGIVQESLDVSRQQLMAMVDTGELSWVWDISTKRLRKELRVLGHCVVDRQSGPVSGIGATKSLKLPEVLNLILPQVRPSLRGVEIQRLLACSPDAVRDLHQAGELVRVKETIPSKGINASPRFTRASVAKFLSDRRLV